MNLLLSENLPLRMTRDLGDYAENKPLPHRYGDLTSARFDLIRLSDDRWFAADHQMQITSVFVGDQETYSWAAEVESDGDGRSWQIVRFSAPVEANTKASACGKGKLNAKTGALIENPADVMEDILRIAGRSSFWGQLRSECAAAGLLVAGSLSEVISIREALDRVARSVGAIWTPGNIAGLYPASVPSGYIAELEKLQVGDITVEAKLDDTCDVLRIGYDREDATNRPQKNMELTASPQRLGGIVADLELPWLRSSANAEQVGRRMLERLAGERYGVTFSTNKSDLRPGSWVRLIDPPEWPFDGSDPVLKVLSVDIELQTRAVQVIAEYLRAVPQVTVTAYSLALASTVSGSLEVSQRDGIATFTVYDSDNKPLAGARVSFDGGLPKTTDEQGQVSFVYVPGTHEIVIEAPGMMTQTLQVTL